MKGMMAACQSRGQRADALEAARARDEGQDARSAAEGDGAGMSGWYLVEAAVPLTQGTHGARGG